MKTPICAVADIPASGAKKVTFFGREALVFRHNGEVRAVMSTCTHLGGPLELRGGRFVCGWHGAEFGCDGACAKGPAPLGSRLMFLPTRVEGANLDYVYGE